MTKICNNCHKAKLSTEFFKRKLNPDGRTNTCADCLRRIKKSRKNFSLRKTHPKRLKKYPYRMGENKVTREIYDKLVALKGSACNICGKVPNYRLIVDHCHNYGHVRGLLCRQCNTGLGMFKDNKDFLATAINYLDSKIYLKSL